MSETPHASESCPNCGAVWGGARPDFCPSCGQETHVRPPTLGEFLQQFGGAYLSTEGALWRTLRLLTRPGELTRQYLAGRRKHYVLPLRLYLTVSVIVLLVARLAAVIQFEVKGPALQMDGSLTNGRIDLVVARAGLKDGVFFCEGFPTTLCKRIERRLTAKPEQLAHEFADMGERLVGAIGPTMFVLLPGFALWLMLVYWNRGLRYTEHLVFALHLHTAWFIVLALTLLPLGGWESLFSLVVPVYSWMAMRHVYGGRTWALALRAAVVSLGYGTMLLAGIVAATVWVLVS